MKLAHRRWRQEWGKNAKPPRNDGSVARSKRGKGAKNSFKLRKDKLRQEDADSDQEL